MQAKRNFENLDLIIIAGDLSITPWTHHSLNQTQTLVRQAMLYQKSLIGIGLGANLIGMYAATKMPFNYKYETIDLIKNLQFDN